MRPGSLMLALGMAVGLQALGSGQWALWATEQKFTQASFEKAFLEHTQKNVRAVASRPTASALFFRPLLRAGSVAARLARSDRAAGSSSVLIGLAGSIRSLRLLLLVFSAAGFLHHINCCKQLPNQVGAGEAIRRGPATGRNERCGSL